MFTQFATTAFLLQQEVGFDMVSMWNQMGFAAKAVVVVMFLMSAWSIGVMIDRALAYTSAKKQSRQFAPAVAGALREGKLEEAIELADRYKKSHLAKVVTAGLAEFKAHTEGADIPGGTVDASKRALERAQAITHAEVEPRPERLGHHRLDRSVRRIVRHVVGIINAFQGISQEKSTGLGAVAGGISEALVATAIGLFVALPAVWMFNYYNSKVEGFDVEMENSSSELIDYFLKRTGGKG